MPYFLINRRLKEGDRSYEVGEIAEFDPTTKSTQILLARELIAPVPADFAAAVRSEAPPSPPAEPAADDEVTLEDLMELKRPELDDQATQLGIEDAGSLPNKQAVAEAILAKLAEEDAESEEASDEAEDDEEDDESTDEPEPEGDEG